MASPLLFILSEASMNVGYRSRYTQAIAFKNNLEHICAYRGTHPLLMDYVGEKTTSSPTYRYLFPVSANDTIAAELTHIIVYVYAHFFEYEETPTGEVQYTLTLTAHNNEDVAAIATETMTYNDINMSWSEDYLYNYAPYMFILTLESSLSQKLCRLEISTDAEQFVIHSVQAYPVYSTAGGYEIDYNLQDLEGIGTIHDDGMKELRYQARYNLQYCHARNFLTWSRWTDIISMSADGQVLPCRIPIAGKQWTTETTNTFYAKAYVSSFSAVDATLELRGYTTGGALVSSGTPVSVTGTGWYTMSLSSFADAKKDLIYDHAANLYATLTSGSFDISSISIYHY